MSRSKNHDLEVHDSKQSIFFFSLWKNANNISFIWKLVVAYTGLTVRVQMQDSCIEGKHWLVKRAAGKQINSLNLCFADICGYGMYLQTYEL